MKANVDGTFSTLIVEARLDLGSKMLEPCNNIIQSGYWTGKQHPGPTNFIT